MRHVVALSCGRGTKATLPAFDTFRGGAAHAGHLAAREGGGEILMELSQTLLSPRCTDEKFILNGATRGPNSVCPSFPKSIGETLPDDTRTQNTDEAPDRLAERPHLFQNADQESSLDGFQSDGMEVKT
jgi:hypothetical protein